MTAAVELDIDPTTGRHTWRFATVELAIAFSLQSPHAPVVHTAAQPHEQVIAAKNANERQERKNATVSVRERSDRTKNASKQPCQNPNCSTGNPAKRDYCCDNCRSEAWRIRNDKNANERQERKNATVSVRERSLTTSSNLLFSSKTEDKDLVVNQERERTQTQPETLVAEFLKLTKQQPRPDQMDFDANKPAEELAYAEDVIQGFGFELAIELLPRAIEFANQRCKQLEAVKAKPRPNPKIKWFTAIARNGGWDAAKAERDQADKDRKKQIERERARKEKQAADEEARIRNQVLDTYRPHFDRLPKKEQLHWLKVACPSDNSDSYFNSQLNRSNAILAWAKTEPALPKERGLSTLGKALEEVVPRMGTPQHRETKESNR